MRQFTGGRFPRRFHSRKYRVYLVSAALFFSAAWVFVQLSNSSGRARSHVTVERQGFFRNEESQVDVQQGPQGSLNIDSSSDEGHRSYVLQDTPDGVVMRQTQGTKR